jgi:hypothetical protein
MTGKGEPLSVDQLLALIRPRPPVLTEPVETSEGLGYFIFARRKGEIPTAPLGRAWGGAFGPEGIKRHRRNALIALDVGERPLMNGEAIQEGDEFIINTPFSKWQPYRSLIGQTVHLPTSIATRTRRPVMLPRPE